MVILMEDHLTTYQDRSTKKYEAIQLPWHVVNEVLGYEHTGSAEDDNKLVEVLLASGAPEWVKDAEGWIDEYGWGLIGPEILDEEG